MRFNLQAIAGHRHWQWLRRNGPLLLGVLLLVGASWQAAVLTWAVTDTVITEPALPPATALADGSTADNARESMQSVAAMHLFGDAATPADALAAVAADAPETSLNLTLRGILAADADTPELSRAVIASGSDEKVYAVGDTIPGGATVEAVLPDRVLLRRGGRLETLRLPRELADASISYGETTEPDRDAAVDIGDVRAEIAADPTRLSELIRYSPVLEDGSIRGYRIYPGRDRARFAQFGLQPGDIVTAINGTPLADPAQAVEMLNSLTDAASITLTVERNGASQDITLAPSQ